MVMVYRGVKSLPFNQPNMTKIFQTREPAMASLSRLGASSKFIIVYENLVNKTCKTLTFMTSLHVTLFLKANQHRSLLRADVSLTYAFAYIPTVIK